MIKIKIAVAQYEIPESANEALKKVNDVLENAHNENVELIVLPETAIGNLGSIDKIDNEYMNEFCNLAKKYKLSVSTSLYVKENQNIYNRGIIVSQEGKVILKHDKIYLASPENNNHKIKEGNNLNVVNVSNINIGMLVCKDGFNKYSHNLYSQFNAKNTKIICAPTWSITWSNMPTQKYIRTSFEYGAFISRSFVLVAGNTNKGSFGESMIINPIKGIIKMGSVNKEELLMEIINLDDVQKAREFDKVWQPGKQIY